MKPSDLEEARCDQYEDDDIETCPFNYDVNDCGKFKCRVVSEFSL